MEWDLGPEGLAVLGLLSVGFGLIAALVGGHGRRRRSGAFVATTVACLAVGVLTSEVLFGWATEEELQPNIDGLSRDEVLLSSLVTTVVVVVVSRRLDRRSTRPPGQRDVPGHGG